jgi:hypothetical protein
MKEGHDQYILKKDFVLRKITRYIYHSQIELQSIDIVLVDCDDRYTNI